jgi:hypothetical protein
MSSKLLRERLAFTRINIGNTMRKTLELVITALLIVPALVWVLFAIAVLFLAVFGIIGIVGWALTGIASFGLAIGEEALAITFWAINQLRDMIGEFVWFLLLAVPVAVQHVWYRDQLEELKRK